MKTTPNAATAIATFAARAANIAKNASKLAAAIEKYDRQVSIAGDHSSWEHAGTLGHVEELLGRALEAITSATVSTHTGARRIRRAAR